MVEERPKEDGFEGMEWTVHPVFERGGRAVAAVVVLLLLSLSAGIFGRSALWSVFALVLLVFQLNRFFFRSRFVLDGEGCVAVYPVGGMRRCLWREVTRFSVGLYGGFLHTGEARGLLGIRRDGLHVLFGRDRDRVIGQIRAALREWGVE